MDQTFARSSSRSMLGKSFPLTCLVSYVKEANIHVWIYRHRSVGELGRVDVNSSCVEIERLFQQKDRRINNHIKYLPLVEEYPAIRGFFDSSHFTALLPTMSTSHFYFKPFVSFRSHWGCEM